MTLGQWFLAIGILLVIFEMFTLTFWLLPAGIACLITAGVSGFVSDLGTQLLVLAISFFVTLAFFQKFVRKHLNAPKHPSNLDGLVGKVGVVEEAIDAAGTRGYVKVYGDSWRAVALAGEDFAVGTQVVVERFEGNKVIVRKV